MRLIAALPALLPPTALRASIRLKKAVAFNSRIVVCHFLPCKTIVTTGSSVTDAVKPFRLEAEGLGGRNVDASSGLPRFCRQTLVHTLVQLTGCLQGHGHDATEEQADLGRGFSSFRRRLWVFLSLRSASFEAEKGGLHDVSFLKVSPMFPNSAGNP